MGKRSTVFSLYRTALLGCCYVAMFACSPAFAQTSGSNTNAQTSPALQSNQCNLSSANCYSAVPGGAPAGATGAYAPTTPSDNQTGIQAHWTYVAGAIRANSPTPMGAIDVWNNCHYVANSDSNSFFVPFNNATEWNSFITNHPPNVSITDCTKPATLTVSPMLSGTKYNPSPATYSASEPYYYPCAGNTTPCGTAYPYTVSTTFTYNPPGGGPWTETATAIFTNGDSSPGQSYASSGGWVTPPAMTYTSSPAASCGSATSSTTPPTTNLCAVGYASSVSGGTSGPWGWTCNTTASSPTSANTANCSTSGSGCTATPKTWSVSTTTCNGTTLVTSYGTTTTATETDGVNTGTASFTCSSSGTLTLVTNPPPTCTSNSVTCGSAAGSTPVPVAPTTNLCSDGSTPPVTLSSDNNWKWSCGTSSPANCSVPSSAQMGCTWQPSSRILARYCTRVQNTPARAIPAIGSSCSYTFAQFIPPFVPYQTDQDPCPLAWYDAHAIQTDGVGCNCGGCHWAHDGSWVCE